MPDWVSGPMILGALAGILAIASAVWSSIEETRHAKEQARHVSEENRLLTKLDSKNEEINAAQKQMIAAQKESLDHFTGGDSIFYLHFSRSVEGTLEALYKIHGKHPVPNIHLHVTDFTAVGQLKGEGKAPTEIKEKATREQAVGTYWPGAPLSFARFPFPESGNALFRIIIIQPKGLYVQFALIAKPEGQPERFAYRSFRMLGERNGKTELERLDHPSYTDSGFTETGIGWVENPTTWNTQYVIKDADDQGDQQ